MGQIVTFSGARGYLAEPEAASLGGLILIQEWWGLVPHIQDLADRFAAAGFVTLAPDFYNGAETTEPDEAAKLMMQLRLSEAAALITNAAALLTARDDVSAPVAAVGFCMGGGLAMLAGASSDDIGVAIGFYPATPWEDYAPDWSRYAGKAAFVHAAESDGGAGSPNLVAMGEGISAAGGSYTSYDYPGTQHAFFNDARPEVYDADASGLAWSRVLKEVVWRS